MQLSRSAPLGGLVLLLAAVPFPSCSSSSSPTVLVPVATDGGARVDAARGDAAQNSSDTAGADGAGSVEDAAGSDVKGTNDTALADTKSDAVRDTTADKAAADTSPDQAPDTPLVEEDAPVAEDVPPDVSPDTTAAISGLAGAYFTGTDLEDAKYVVSFIDPLIDFTGPALDTLVQQRLGVTQDYSIRWLGQVFVDNSDIYTFYVRASGGVRLWVDNLPVINDWSVSAITERSGPRQLEQGQWYDIRLETFQNTPQGEIQLSYSAALESKKIIPEAKLRNFGIRDQ